jgi:hypothetical protein
MHTCCGSAGCSRRRRPAGFRLHHRQRLVEVALGNAGFLVGTHLQELPHLLDVHRGIAGGAFDHRQDGVAFLLRDGAGFSFC